MKEHRAIEQQRKKLNRLALRTNDLVSLLKEARKMDQLLEQYERARDN